ncbi:MAG: hypothetical protein LRY66_02370 [Saccharospirillaceae bacterium]|nr:hypothetical protein [Saccharospirillaceae bacterium]MCD8530207.1 hypothetical protein [Saccharospirillaceae bacterium]
MKHVLFISHSKRGAHFYQDASARYRCIFPAEHLNACGITAHVVHVSQIHQLDLNNYSHLIAHRPQDSYRVRQYLKKARKAAVQCIVDFDDLLFHPEITPESPAVLSGSMPLREARRQARLYRKALLRFDRCWASTQPLAEELRKAHPGAQIDVFYNKLPARWPYLTALIPAKERLAHKIIRYLPGTSHHRHDFAKIEQALAGILHKNPDITLEIVGPLDCDESQFPETQLQRQAFVTFEELPAIIASSWVTIAPLQNNRFNQCKSGLKFWESGILAVPVVSSPSHDINRCANAGLITGISADNIDEITSQLSDPEQYARLCDAARTKAQESVFTSENPDGRLQNLKLENHIKSRLTEQKTEEERFKYYSNQQLKMTAHFGPDWPATILNPTHSQYQTARELWLAETEFHTDDIQQLNIKAKALTEAARQQKTNRILRKARKLIRTPGLFFKDALAKRL